YLNKHNRTDKTTLWQGETVQCGKIITLDVMENAIAISFFLLTFVCQGSGQCKMLVCRFSPFRRSQTKLTSLDNDFNLCPYIIIENVQNNAENVITVKTQVRAVYPWILQAKRQNPNLKFVLAFVVFTFFDMYHYPVKRSELFQACVKHLRDNGFDGMTIELGDRSPSKDSFANFIQDAQNTFTEEARRTGKPKLLLFGDLTYFYKYIQRNYDLPRIYSSTDYVIFNTLPVGEYSWSGLESLEALGRRHHSRIYRLDPEDTFNLDYYFKWIVSLGAVKSKTIVSTNLEAIFYYNDRPPQIAPRYLIVRFIDYGEVCDFLKKGGQITRVLNISPFQVNAQDLVFYDDEFSVKERIKYVKKLGVAGFNFANLEADDFRGNCGRGKWPLLRAVSEECRKS
ncbi:chitinase-3-like protein 1, partial [Biomphalaria glabrata]